MNSEIEYLLDKVSKLEKKVDSLEGLVSKQGNYLNYLQKETED